MDSHQLIEQLHQTQDLLHQGGYAAHGTYHPFVYTLDQMKQARIILPDEELWMSEAVKKRAAESCGMCWVNVKSTDSFGAAFDLNREIRQEKADRPMDGTQKPVLVLNFANPVHPGGGVRIGAAFQEEDLCRQSSLLQSLESKEAGKYYEFNKSTGSAMGSDALILSENVEVFRKKDGSLARQPFAAAVLTCAAPMIANGMEGFSYKQYEKLLFRRMLRMLHAAASYGYRNLVLGAWGCGAFGNDPYIIAAWFKRALEMLYLQDYPACALFDHIVFAIPDRSARSKNYLAFCRAFENRMFVRSFDRSFSSLVPISSYTKPADSSAGTLWHLHAFSAEEAALQVQIRDRARGCLIGGAAGDALGYAVEFVREDEIFRQYGAPGIQFYELDRQTGKAVVSDDTQMSMFTAEGLIWGRKKAPAGGNLPIVVNEVQNAYQNWLDTQQNTYYSSDRNQYPNSDLMKIADLYVCRAPGTTCLNALSYHRQHPAFHQSYLTDPINNSKGCGGVMRTAPAGLLKAAWMDADTACRLGAELAAITHSHPLGWLSGALLSEIIWRIVYERKGSSLKGIISFSNNMTCHRFITQYPEAKTLRDLIDRAIELSGQNGPVLSAIHELGEGWVGEERWPLLFTALFASNMIFPPACAHRSITEGIPIRPEPLPARFLAPGSVQKPFRNAGKRICSLRTYFPDLLMHLYKDKFEVCFRHE